MRRSKARFRFSPGTRAGAPRPDVRVRALDPRLLRRARSARVLLLVDAALGLATALLVLVQATLLAHGRRPGVRRAVARDVATARAARAAFVAARGALAWGFEVAGRRAAATVLSRAAARRSSSGACARSPAALDGAESGEVAAAAVQGVDALEAYFARYLPQLVLACVVPLAVLVWVAASTSTRRS